MKPGEKRPAVKAKRKYHRRERPNTSSLGLLRVDEVARELDISKTSVGRLIASGALRCVRYSRKLVRVHRDDLLAYVAGLRGGARA